MLIEEAFEQVRKFNEIAGVFEKVDEESINLQLSLCFEELEETITAFEKGDAVELLDGAVDIFVTGCGLLLKLDAMGFNVQEALVRVNANNLSKFVPVGEYLNYSHDLTPTVNEKYQVTVLHDASGKIRKPNTFVPVDLTDLVVKIAP